MTRNVPSAGFDSTIALMREGYPFIWNRCRALQTELFTTRILGRPAVCIHGPAAARLFYDESKLKRHGAVPRRVVTSLFGKKAVHTLDGYEHRHRKALFMSLMTPAHIELLMRCMEAQWRMALPRWASLGRVVLFDEAQRILTSAVCAWAGIPLGRYEVALRAEQLGAMVDAFGALGPRLWRGKRARVAAQSWLAGVVEQVRKRKLLVEPNTALHAIATHRDLRGKLLSTRTAAVELLNVIRPTSAIAWYIADAAHALHTFPNARAQLESARPEDDYATLFMHEVRRFYPFTPYVGAKVHARFEWRGHVFRPGTLVLLDVYGASRDTRLWEEPDAFRPERFAGGNPHLYTFIPQGGGSATIGHRCAGEWITMESIRLALRFLVHGVRYDVERYQDLSLDLTRMPTCPASGVILENVRAGAPVAEVFPPAAGLSARVTASAMGVMREPPV